MLTRHRLWSGVPTGNRLSWRPPRQRHQFCRLSSSCSNLLAFMNSRESSKRHSLSDLLAVMDNRVARRSGRDSLNLPNGLFVLMFVVRPAVLSVLSCTEAIPTIGRYLTLLCRYVTCALPIPSFCRRATVLLRCCCGLFAALPASCAKTDRSDAVVPCD